MYIVKAGIELWLKYSEFKFKGELHLLPPKAPKLACFVLYLKIVNNFFFEKSHMHLIVMSKELKNSIKIKVGQALLELLIQN